MTLLSHPALVLNKSWVAITTTPVRRALSLMYVGAARAIEPGSYETHDFDAWFAMEPDDDEPAILAVTRRVRVPEVILLTLYNGLPRTEVAFSRRNLFRRDGNQCQYCGCKPGASELTIDHVIPRSRGGKSTWENCVVACANCNRRKADRLPQHANMKMLREPRRPAWTPHLDVAAGDRRDSWGPFLRSPRNQGLLA